MHDPIIFMFSGQGSQYYQMGRGLFQTCPIFRQCMYKLNKIVSDLIGESVLNRLYDEEERISDRFDRMLYTHPAIFMVGYSLAQVLRENGIEPDFVMGTSLGEFTAAAVSGVMSADELLELLVRQAQLVETNCEEGGMLAILDNMSLYKKIPALYQNTEVASVNYDSHFVVSGRREKLQYTEFVLADNGIIFQDLPVPYAFHSHLLEPASKQYKKLLDHKTNRFPEIK